MADYGIVYIAGPMSAHSSDGYNYAAFDAAEACWREAGWLVESPTKSGRCWGYDKPYEFYLKLAIEQLLRSNAIAMLPGWRDSRGATIEYLLARALGYPIYNAVTMQPMDPVALLGKA